MLFRKQSLNLIFEMHFMSVIINDTTSKSIKEAKTTGNVKGTMTTLNDHDGLFYFIFRLGPF